MYENNKEKPNSKIATISTDLFLIESNKLRNEITSIVILYQNTVS